VRAGRKEARLGRRVRVELVLMMIRLMRVRVLDPVVVPVEMGIAPDVEQGMGGLRSDEPAQQKR